MPNFVETNICKDRRNCVSCRREEKFRKHFEKQNGGPWECPIGIPINAPDDRFPPELIQTYNAQIEQSKKREEQNKLVEIAFEELSMMLSGEALDKVNFIRSVFQPRSKVASKCNHSTKQIGEVDQVCCGGTVKKVTAFDCKKHTVCTDRKCHNCNDFVFKKA